jgi:hypothetical protein
MVLGTLGANGGIFMGKRWISGKKNRKKGEIAWNSKQKKIKKISCRRDSAK